MSNYDIKFEIIKLWSKIIIDFIESQTIDKLSIVCGDNYSIDLALLEPDNKPYFIEINPFGKEYTSGSSLFHWIIGYHS